MPIDFTDALKIALPGMVTNEIAMNDIAEILQEYTDEIKFNSTLRETLNGRNDDDVFDIEIMEFHGIFWIRANEFDDIGYFNDLANAVAYANNEYESYIDAYLYDEDEWDEE